MKKIRYGIFCLLYLLFQILVAGGGCCSLQTEIILSSAALSRRLQAEVLVIGPRGITYNMWEVLIWATWCLMLVMGVVDGCKKKTICRPPPGGRPGCGGR